MKVEESNENDSFASVDVDGGGRPMICFSECHQRWGRGFVSKGGSDAVGSGEGKS